jgi:hypothetical protein
MVSNNQWPFENASQEFYDTIPQELVESMEEMLHHVQPGRFPYITIPQELVSPWRRCCTMFSQVGFPTLPFPRSW